MRKIKLNSLWVLVLVIILLFKKYVETKYNDRSFAPIYFWDKIHDFELNLGNRIPLCAMRYLSRYSDHFLSWFPNLHIFMVLFSNLQVILITFKKKPTSKYFK